MTAPSEHPERWRRLWEVFHAALDSAPADRAAVIQRGCAGDSALAQEVRELLDAHGTEAVLDRPLIGRAVDAPPFEPGTLLADRFRVVRHLGSGGMGTVYEAVDEELGATVAIKTLHSTMAANPEALERFRREALLARRVTHPNACRIFDLCRHDDGARGTACLTMELVTGQTLADYLTATGPLDEAQALPIVEQVAGALSAAHRVGIVHRDLKSANVMLTPDVDGSAPRVVVTDFGLAAAMNSAGHASEHLTRSGQLLGTPAAMAPEQLQGHAVTPATDVYALGLLMYEMVTGALPFAGESPLTVAVRRVRDEAPPPRDRRPDLSAVWNSTILRCLQRDPADRFPSADAVLDALRSHPLRHHAFVPRRLRRRLIGAGAVAGALLLAAATPPLWRAGADGVATPSVAFDARDWVLVADIENRTGEEVLDDTVRFAIERELTASRFVNLVPRERVADALRLMKRPADTPLDPNVAREVAVRDGGIRALVRGRIEKLGSTYVTSIELVEPLQDFVLASLAEQAGDQSQILDATRTLSDRLRAAVGEDLRSGGDRGARLAQVSTTSLRALQLFSRADAMIAQNGGDRAAEELLRQSISEDPEFASAYMHLAHALRNQGRRDEALEHAATAVALSASATEGERQFIRGSYYSMTGDYTQALASYLALVELYPDHYWGASNVGMILSFGLLRGEDAVPHFQRAAALRPHDFAANRNAAWNIAVRGNNVPAAHAALDRARTLLTPELTRQYGSAAIWVEIVPAYERWLRDDVQGAFEAVQRLQAGLSTHPLPLPASYHLMRVYETLGRFKDAHALVRPPGLSAVGLVVAYLRGDEETLARWRDLKVLEPRLRNSLGGLGPIILARLGRVALAKTAMPLGRTDRSVAPIVFEHAFAGATPIIQGEIALAERRLDDAIRLLQEGLPAERLTGSAVYFLGVESLAQAWLARGDAERAIAVLEDALRQRHRTIQGSGAFWVRVAWQLAATYRQAGRTDDASKLESQLRRLLALADADHPVIVAMAGGAPPAGDRTR